MTITIRSLITVSSRSLSKALMQAQKSFVLCAFFYSSCATTEPQNTPSPLQVLPKAALLLPVKADEILISQQIKLIEDAFSKKQCETVQEHVQRIEKIASSEKTLPTSTVLALRYCKAILKPSNETYVREALEIIDTAQKELTPNWNAITLESLNAEIYKVTNQKSKLLASKNKQRSLAQWHSDLRVQIDAEIFGLAEGTSTYTSAQKEQLDKILKAWPQSKNLFQILFEIEQLAADLSSTSDKQPLVLFRNAVLIEIEEKFALETSLIQRAISETDLGLAQSLAASAKNTFPLSTYINRIDAMFAKSNADHLGAPSQPTPAIAVPVIPTSELVPLTNQDPELAYESAKKSINDGQPENAVTIIDALPKATLNDKLLRLRKEAVESYVRKTRLRVRNLFNQANASKDIPTRTKLLKECESMLTELIKKFPDAPGRQGIERNIRNLQMEMKEPNK